MENLKELIKKRRSIRQFQPKELSLSLLKELVDCGRLAPSAANLQPLEFLIAIDPNLRKEIFPCLRWAAYINPAGDPKPGKEPVAYIIILVNMDIRKEGFEYDVGAAAENIILEALSQGVGTCWLISINRERLKKNPEYSR
ncbi:MAG: nitroreductase family protein [Candidatus Saccharicenans sp.]